VNIGVLASVAAARGFLKADARLAGMTPRIMLAAAYAAAIVWLVSAPLAAALDGVLNFRAELYLVAVGTIALLSYGVMLLGVGWKR
jgi:hypothetical protein